MPNKSFIYFDGLEEKRAANNFALYKDLVDKLREVFGVKRFEDGGLTELETVELTRGFLDFMVPVVEKK